MKQKKLIWIDSTEQLKTQAERWMSKAWLSMDTEFERTSTFYSKAALIQCADDEQFYFIDPLLVKDLSPLAGVLGENGPLKIMHAMSEDVELLKQETGAVLANVFDTQVSACMLSLGDSLGYQALVSQVLGAEVDKSETRSNWMQRPLTESQITYAADDVAHLYPLYQALKSKLDAQGRYDWAMQECDVLCKQSSRQQRQTETYYYKFKHNADWPQWKQRILVDLVNWRETKARSENKPRSWVLADKQIIELIDSMKRLPVTLEANDYSGVDLSATWSEWQNAIKIASNGLALLRCADLKRSQIHAYETEIIPLLIDSLGQLISQPDNKRFSLIPPPFKGALLKRYKKLKSMLVAVAGQNALPPIVLTNKKMLESMVRQAENEQVKQLPSHISPWKQQILFPAWVSWLAEYYPELS